MDLLVGRVEVIDAAHLAESLRAEIECLPPAVPDLPLVFQIGAVAVHGARDVREQRVEVDLQAVELYKQVIQPALAVADGLTTAKESKDIDAFYAAAADFVGARTSKNVDTC